MNDSERYFRTAFQENLANSGEYQSFTRGSQVEMIDLRMGSGRREAVPARLLLGVSSPTEELVTLAFPDRLVTVEGRALGKLVDALLAHTVQLVREFDVKRWPEPPVGEPLVQTITVKVDRPPGG